MPATTGDDMCRFIVNLAGNVYLEDCKSTVTREGTPQRYLAARLYQAGYDVWTEGALYEVCLVGDASFTTGARRFDVMAGKGQVKVRHELRVNLQ